MHTRRVAAAVITLPLAAWACGGSPSGPSEKTDASTLDGFIVSAVAHEDSAAVTAVSHPGAPPSAGGGPAVTVTSIPDAVVGGENLLEVQSTVPIQTIYVSVVSSSAPALARSAPWLSPLTRALVTPVMAASHPSGYLQFNLSAPATVVPIALKYPMSLPSGAFTLGVQGAAGGAPGPVATADKIPAVAVVELVGIVYGSWIGTPRTPGDRPDPIAGATVSTSLDSRTAVTDKNGLFDLKTATASTSCFTITIQASGLPTYAASRQFGSDAIIAYTLGSTPQYPIPSGCSGG
jgi:hypothetical protein